MFTVHTPDLISSEDSWPLMPATSRLNVDVLRHIAANSGKKIGQRIWAHLSPITLSSLEVSTSKGEMEELLRFYDFKACDQMPRHDFTNGRWVKYDPNDARYLCATHEDASFSLTKRKPPFLFLRFRRLTHRNLEA